MDEQIRKELAALMPALKSLGSSVDRAHATGMVNGVGKMAVRTYSVLHGKIASMLPGDVYITDALKLDATENDEEEAQVAQVSLATGQLYSYVKNLLADEDPWLRQEDMRELKNLGRDLQERIVNQTRSALRRALAGLEDIPVPPVPPTPPMPPAPHVPAPPPPPPAPGFAGRIRIELDDDDESLPGEKPKNPPTPPKLDII